MGTAQLCVNRGVTIEANGYNLKIDICKPATLSKTEKFLAPLQFCDSGARDMPLGCKYFC